MTALDRLIEKYKSGALMTPLETCVLEQTLKPGDLALAAAAELALKDGGLATQLEVSEARRVKIERLERDRDDSVCIACQREHNAYHIGLK